MIVTCERCEQRYRIRSEKLPPQGGKIRCPTCRHVFIVKPPAEGEEDDRTPSPDSAAAESAMMGAAKPAETAAKPAETPAKPAEPPAKPAAAPEVATKVPEKAAPKAKAAEEAAPPTGATWKLRVSGLTYAFQTLDSLQSWLSSRDNVEGIKIARNADDWGELGDYPDVLTSQLAIKFFPLGDIPTSLSKSAILEAAPKPAESARSTVEKKPGEKPRSKAALKPAAKQSGARDKATKGKAKGGDSLARLWLVVLLLGAVALGFGLHYAEIIRLPFFTSDKKEFNVKFTPGPARDALTNDTPPVGDSGSSDKVVTFVEPDAVEEGSEGPDPNEAIAAEQAFREGLDKAIELIGQKQWAMARGILERLYLERPEDLELNEAILKVYRGLNMKSEADQAKKRIDELKKNAG